MYSFKTVVVYILHEHFHIIGNHMVSYTEDTTIEAVIPRPLSHPQVMESPNRGLVAIHSWRLKWHKRRNSKKTNSMVVS